MKQTNEKLELKAIAEPMASTKAQYPTVLDFGRNSDIQKDENRNVFGHPVNQLERKESTLQLMNKNAIHSSS